MKAKNSKKRKIIIAVLIVLALLFSAGALAYNKLNDIVAETLITKVAASSADDSAGSVGDSGSNSAAENVYKSMSDADQAIVKDIVTNHVSATTVAEVTELLRNDDTEGLKEYAYENLSDGEITELKELYDKYK